MISRLRAGSVGRQRLALSDWRPWVGGVGWRSCLAVWLGGVACGGLCRPSAWGAGWQSGFWLGDWVDRGRREAVGFASRASVRCPGRHFCQTFDLADAPRLSRGTLENRDRGPLSRGGMESCFMISRRQRAERGDLGLRAPLSVRSGPDLSTVPSKRAGLWLHRPDRFKPPTGRRRCG